MLRLDINLVFTIINLLLLYFAMRRFLLKPVRKIIEERRKMTDEAFAEAKSREEAADQKKAEYETSLQGIEEERAKVLAEAKAEAQKESQKILDSAREEADETIRTAQAQALRDRDKLYKETENEITEMILNASSKVLAAKLPEESDRQLYDKFITKAGEKN